MWDRRPLMWVIAATMLAGLAQRSQADPTGNLGNLVIRVMVVAAIAVTETII